MIENIHYYFNQLLKNDVSIEEYADDAFAYRLFNEIFGTVPYVMYFFEEIGGNDLDDDDDEDFTGEFNYKETCKNIRENVKCQIYRWKNAEMFIGEEWLVFKGVIYNIKPEIPDELSDCVVMSKTDTANLIFVSVNSRGGFIKKLLPVKEVDIDYSMNYNEDFPHERIEEIITEDKSALILNFGIPGTGNIIFIRYI